MNGYRVWSPSSYRPRFGRAAAKIMGVVKHLWEDPSVTSPRDKHAAYHPVDKPSFNPPPQALMQSVYDPEPPAPGSILDVDGDPAQAIRSRLGAVIQPTLEERVAELERKMDILYGKPRR